ncbi:MAG: VOC family protein [Acidimicrobiia bacterium]|nr:VOC family protein [Acidimicrobiia bacterium]
MASIQSVTFDCAEPPALARFWADVLGWGVSPDADENIAAIGGPNRKPDEPSLLFLAVPEGKAAKNRCHLDLDCDDLDAEGARVEALGATFVHEKQEYGLRWMTFTDPEGNEFCLAHH